MGSVSGYFLFWRRRSHFFGDGLIILLFDKETTFGSIYWVVLVNLIASPSRQLSGLELLNCQWEYKSQAVELFVALVCEQSLVLLHLEPDSVRLKA